MDSRDAAALDRRNFFKTAGAGVTAAAVMLTPREAALAQEAARRNALDRIASNTYPIRPLFKQRPRPAGMGGGQPAAGGGRSAAAAAAQAELEKNPNARRALEAAEAARPARAHLPGPAEMKKEYGEITMLD